MFDRQDMWFNSRRRGGFRGFGGFGGGGGGFFGGFGGGGPNFGAGRKLMAADLQLLVLAMLAEKPRHGYELIKEMEERSSGFYAPSPGVIYPALTYLEELGFASLEASGSKKLYSITPEGKKYLEANGKNLEAMMQDLAHIGERMQKMKEFFSQEEAEEPGHLRHSDEFHQARHALKNALRQKHHCSAEEAHRIAEILHRAASEIVGN